MLSYLLRGCRIPILNSFGGTIHKTTTSASIGNCHHDSLLSICRSYSRLFSSTSQNPHEFALGKVITVSLSSNRFDKIIRKGLNMSQLDFEKYFYEQSFRLNDEKVLKKSIKLEEGDILDLIVREEDGKVIGKRVVLLEMTEKMSSSLKKIYSRPPLTLFLGVLFLCVGFLLSAIVRFQAQQSIPDPDVKTNAAKMIRTFLELEFCSEPWNSSSKHFQLNDAFLLNLENSASDKVFSRNFRLRITYSYPPSSVSKSLFAQMRGSHLGFTGSDAFEKINVSLLVPDFDPSQRPCEGPDCKSHIFESCLSLAAPTKLFPIFHNHLPCTRNQLIQIKKNNSAHLLWQKRFHLVDRQRCQKHVTWEPHLIGKSPLIPTLSPDDIWLITQRLLLLIGVLLGIIGAICLSLVCVDASPNYHRLLPLRRATSASI